MEKDICTLLREIKQAKGWTELRLSAEIGTSQPTINRILGGQKECKITTFQSISALHEAVCAATKATP